MKGIEKRDESEYWWDAQSIINQSILHSSSNAPITGVTVDLPLFRIGIWYNLVRRRSIRILMEQHRRIATLFSVSTKLSLKIQQQTSSQITLRIWSSKSVLQRQYAPRFQRQQNLAERCKISSPFFKRNLMISLNVIRCGEEVFGNQEIIVLYQGKVPRTYDFNTMYTWKRGWVKVLMRCTVDLPDFEFNRTYYLFYTLSLYMYI